MKKELMIVMAFVFGIMLVGLVSAWSNSTFNNSLSTEDLTYSGEGNITRFLEVPGNVFFTKAYLNLSGIGWYNSSNYFIQDEDSGNVSDTSQCGSCSFADNCLVDYCFADEDDETYENYETPFSTQTKYVWNYENFTGFSGQVIGSMTISSKFGYDVSSQSSGLFVFALYVGDCVTSENVYQISHGPGAGYDIDTITVDVPEEYWYSDPICVRKAFTFRGHTADKTNVEDWETWLTVYNDTYYPENVTVYSDLGEVYSIEGNLNYTNSPNRTINLAQIINDYLNILNPTSQYDMPYIFYSGTTGIIRYFDMNFQNEAQYSFTGGLEPECEVNYGSLNDSYYYVGGDSSVENLTCELNGYNDQNWYFNISDGDKEFDFTSDFSTLNLTFSENTTGEIEHEEGSIGFENVGNLYYNLSSFSEGEVAVIFNNGTQRYVFYNDLQTSIEDNIYIHTIDVSRKIKVLGGSQEVAGARVTLKKSVGGEYYVVYSEFTNSNGEALILADDTNNYRIVVEKDGYETYDELHYFAPSDTETIIVNLVSEEDGEGENFVTSGCPSIIGSARYCLFSVQTAQSGVIVGFNYTWNGGNYLVETESDNLVTLNLSATNTTTPITVNVYIDGEYIKTFTITYSELEDRSIQLTFDATEIKSAGTGPLILFYLIAVIIAILIIVSINRMPKAKGWGGIGAVVWFVVLAINGFPEFWFVALIPIIYYVFKALWSD